MIAIALRRDKESIEDRRPMGQNSGAMIGGFSIQAGKIRSENCEVNIVEHCNLTCRACSHLSPAIARQVINPGEMYQDLETLSDAYHANEIRLLGGEPLLHPAIVETIEAARRSGIADSVVVWTNGTLLPRMVEDFWRAVDAVQVAVYPGHELPSEAVTFIKASAKRYGVLLKFNPYPTFRESHARLGTADKDLVARIYSSCRIAHDWSCHVIAVATFISARTATSCLATCPR